MTSVYKTLRENGLYDDVIGVISEYLHGDKKYWKEKMTMNANYCINPFQQIKITSICKYIKSLPYYELLDEKGACDITPEEYDRMFPDLPNYDIDLLRKWWILYRPIAEDEYYEEFYFQNHETGDNEPNDKELVICLYYGEHM